MTASVRNDIARIDAGTADSSAFSRLHKYLMTLDCPDDDLYSAVSVYLEESPVVDWQVALKYVRYPEDPLVAAAAIAAASLRLCPHPTFWSAVNDIAAGEAWDDMDDARIQAILALNRGPSRCDERVKIILRASLEDSSAAVRDSAAIAAQRCFGISENEVLAGGEAGKLPERLQRQVLEWLRKPNG